MILRLDTDSLKKEGVEVGAFLQEFIRTTVAFSVWNQKPRVDCVHIRLESASLPGHDDHFRCTLRADLPGRKPAGAGATGPDIFTAVQEAANLLEVALRHPVRATPPKRIDAQVGAARRRAPGLHSGAPA